MSIFDQLLASAKKVATNAIPGWGTLNAARELISDVLAQKIREEATARAYEILRKQHDLIVRDIIWQNALLLASLIPVYIFHSAIPFYISYVAVLVYTIKSLYASRAIVTRLINTRSITETVAHEIFEAIETELMSRHTLQRKALEWLGPDLKNLASEIAQRLKKDIIAAIVNMGMTLLLAFIAFRIFAIPLLEQQALAH